MSAVNSFISRMPHVSVCVCVCVLITGKNIIDSRIDVVVVVIII